MSTRQTIVDALETALSAILTGGGYHTNAGKNVFVWRLAELTENNLPAIILRDTADPMEDEGVADKIDHLLTIEIEGHCKPAVGSSAEKQARLLMEDILAVLGANQTVGGAYDLRVVSTEMVAKEADRRFAAALIVVNVKYRTARWAL